ncbi:hypothetical protein C8Q76DRAFT_586566, partial [Earliella scabrosa]
YRSRSYQLTRRDYHDYQQRVRAILSRPQARAALAKGGIIWRLVMEIIGAEEDINHLFHDAAASGPSGEYSLYGEVLQCTHETQFVDDVLTIEETDAICGVYKVYTQQNQTQDVSWWPKHEHWIASGTYHARWTPWHETWFRSRLELIQRDEAQLRSASEWRNSLKRYTQTREVNVGLYAACSNFI